MSDIFLRELVKDDALYMLEWMHDFELVQWLAKDFTKFTEEDCVRFIEKNNNKQHLHYAIACKEQNEYLGTISLKNIDDSFQTAELGICIRRKAMGTGTAKEALNTILGIAVDLGIKMVYWCVSKKNDRANRFYEKNGFTQISAPVVAKNTYCDDDLHNYLWYAVELG